MHLLCLYSTFLPGHITTQLHVCTSKVPLSQVMFSTNTSPKHPGSTASPLKFTFDFMRYSSHAVRAASVLTETFLACSRSYMAAYAQGEMQEEKMDFSAHVHMTKPITIRFVRIQVLRPTQTREILISEHQQLKRHGVHTLHALPQCLYIPGHTFLMIKTNKTIHLGMQTYANFVPLCALVWLHLLANAQDTNIRKTPLFCSVYPKTSLMHIATGLARSGKRFP